MNSHLGWRGGVLSRVATSVLTMHTCACVGHLKYPEVARGRHALYASSDTYLSHAPPPSTSQIKETFGGALFCLVGSVLYRRFSSVSQVIGPRLFSRFTPRLMDAPCLHSCFVGRPPVLRSVCRLVLPVATLRSRYARRLSIVHCGSRLPACAPVRF